MARRSRDRRGASPSPPSMCGLEITPSAGVVLRRSVEEESPADAIPEDVVKLFQIFDEDGNGKIDRSELAKVLQELDGAYWNIKRIRALFRAADVDRDQFISWHEFLKWVFIDGNDQRAMRNALRVWEAKKAAEEQAKAEQLAAEEQARAEQLAAEQKIKSEHLTTLGAAESAAALHAALEVAGPCFEAGELQEHERRLEAMRVPFDVVVTTIAGLTCTVEVTRETSVSQLCREVAKHVDKKAYRIVLAHPGGRLEPPTATLEECGITGSHLQLAAQFGEEDALLELPFPVFFSRVILHRLVSQSEGLSLQKQYDQGKLNEDEFRTRFRKPLAQEIEKVEQRMRRQAEEAERKRKREEEERERQRRVVQARRDAILAEHQKSFEGLTLDTLLSRSEASGLGQEATADRDGLIQQLSLVSACQACKEGVGALKSTCVDEEAQAARAAGEAQAVKDEVELLLDEATPALNATLEAMNSLRKMDIDEVKAMRHPPLALRRTLEELCKMCGIKPCRIKDNGKLIADYWQPAVRFTSDSGFLDHLSCYDKDNIPEAHIKGLAPYIDDETCTPENVRKCSKFGEAVCLWLRAMYTYHSVRQDSEPSINCLHEKEAAYAKAMEQLSRTREQLKELMEDACSFERKLEQLMAATK